MKNSKIPSSKIRKRPANPEATPFRSASSKIKLSSDSEFRCKHRTCAFDLITESHDLKSLKRCIGLGILGGMIGIILIVIFNLLYDFVAIPNIVGFICGGVFAGAVVYKDSLRCSLIAGVSAAVFHSSWMLLNMLVFYPLTANVPVRIGSSLLSFVIIFIVLLISYLIGSIIGYFIVHVIKNRI